MALTLTPPLSYLIGMWHATKSRRGLGVRGSEDVKAIFVKGLLDLSITTPDKVLVSDDGSVYVQHVRYKKLFERVESERFIRFKYLNDYSAAFLAGLFDVLGLVKTNTVLMRYHCKDDEVHLNVLGFRTTVVRSEGKRYVKLENPAFFAFFIHHFTKRFSDDSRFQSLVKLAKLRARRR